MANARHVRTIVSHTALNFILQRLARQLIENHSSFDNSILIGVQPRGIELCDRMYQILTSILKKPIEKGAIDISLHRDDIHIQGAPLLMNRTDINISLDQKNIILIDDVLYTGRTIRSAMDALMDYGRPNDVELLVLIDRRLHRHLPIQAKYIGQSIDSVEKERVQVYLNNKDQKDRVEIYTP